MAEYDATALAIFAVVTWSIGLALPLLVRFIFLKRPMAKWLAIVFSFVWLLLNLMFWIALGSQSRTHMVLYIIAFLTYKILVYSDSPKKEKSEENTPTESVASENDPSDPWKGS